MTHSPTIGKLAEALAAAQAKFKPVSKDRNASIVSKTGGSFRYSYADLATAVSAIRDALSANGLAIMQPAHAGEGCVLVTTILAHSSGEWISEVMTWPVVSTDNRSIGSGITYARRHSLLAMVGAAATDEDDDGEQARGGDHDTAKPTHAHKVTKPPESAVDAHLSGKKPNPAALVLWSRVVDECGGDKAKAVEKFDAAAKKFWGTTVPPTTEWTDASVVEVERLLFDVPF